MANIVSAWADEKRVFLVQREGGDVSIRAVPAKWTLFATGLDVDDRSAIGRDSRVRGVHFDGRYTRIDCRNRWARRDVVDILERAAYKAGTRIQILEGDVSPVRRLFSDVASLDVDPSPRLGYFDLETDSRKTFDQARAGSARILSWALTSDGERIESAVLEADSDGAERALLRAFFDAVERFDCLLAWNGDGFDFPVLQERVKDLHFEWRGREVPWHRWTWLDHLEVYRKYNMHSDGGGEEKTSFKLDHVATYLLGEGKQPFDASRTWEAWEAGGERRAELLSYNERDTALLPRIEEKTGFVALHLATCHICRVFPDTESLNATVQGDGFLLRLGVEHGFRWATRRHIEVDQITPFAGAYVMKPTRLGAIDNVHVADFAGLYPAIMRTWNMSPDTKLFPPSDVVESVYRNPTKPIVRGTVCQLPTRPTWFRQDRDGMFRIALDQLVAKRAEYTNAMKAQTPGTPEHAMFKRLSGAFKIVANSFYGICGSPWSRFFDVEIAEGVTQTGKWLLESVISDVRDRGLDPFYGDTDSVFVTGAPGNEFKAIVQDINAEWRDKVAPWGIRDRCHIDLDFEKTFRRLVIVSAKRYAGRYAFYKGKAATEDAAPEVKGLEFKRGDTLKLARAMQSEIVNMLLRDGPLPEIEEIREVIERWRANVLHGELTLEEVTLSQSLTKRIDAYVARFTSDRCKTKGCPTNFRDTDPNGPDACDACGRVRATVRQPAHVRVAKILIDRGEPLGEGSRVSYAMIRSQAKKPDAVPASDPGVLEKIDRSYYWENRIYPATERLLSHVYPSTVWSESTAEKKQRAREVEGQLRLSLGGAPRRRKIADGGVIIELVESSSADDGGAEKIRRELVLKAVRAAIEAHPGTIPVNLHVVWKRALSDASDEKVKVVIPTGLRIETTPAARRALIRVIGDETKVLGFDRGAA